MLDKLAKGAKTLPGVTMLIAAAVAGGVGTAYALNDDGDQGTVTIEQVASEPTASETVAPAPVVATSEPAPVVTSEAPVPAPEETTVAPKPKPTETQVIASSTETFQGVPLPVGEGRAPGMDYTPAPTPSN